MLAVVCSAFLEVARKKGVICLNGLLLSECKYLQPLEQIGAGIRRRKLAEWHRPSVPVLRKEESRLQCMLIS